MMDPDVQSSRFKIGIVEPQMDINFQAPDAATLNQTLSEALPGIEAAMNELDRAQNVSKQVLDGMISV